MKLEQADKKESILEAAIRRFAHFGVHKTTISEIADDLGMTKQALAYYFPDKHSLSEAVHQRLIGEFFSTVELHLEQAPGAAEALMELVDIKKSFIEKYAMLMQAAGPELVRQHTQDAHAEVRRRMISLITARLEKGIAAGELRQMDAAAVAALVVDTISAFEQCAIGRQPVLDAATFSALCSRQKAVLQLMMNGLKKEPWKN